MGSAWGYSWAQAWGNAWGKFADTAAPPTFAHVPRRRPQPFIPAPIPYALLDRRRDDEDALLLSTLL